MVRKMPDFIPHYLAVTAWAFATAGRSDVYLFVGIAAMAELRMDEFEPPDLTNLVWAYMTVDPSSGLWHASLFSAMAMAVQQRMAHFTPRRIANTAMAFAKTSRSDAPLFAML